ncbi:MAG: hypothetical protein AB7M93_30535 [Candidatus Obscuribacterales bacterium]
MHDSDEAINRRRLDFMLRLADESDRDGRLKSSESLYIVALGYTDQLYGPLSPQSGLVANEFLDFCQRHARPVTAMRMAARIRDILSRYFPELRDAVEAEPEFPD